MAKIMLGPIVQSVRGSIGGICFRKVGAKFYASPKSPGPVSPGRTSSEHHALLKQATASWSTLDPAVKEFWARYHQAANPRHPRSGQTFPTPYSLYTCYQLMRLHCGADMLTASVPDPPIFTTSTLHWEGPYGYAEQSYDGLAFIYRTDELYTDKCCLFATPSRNGVTPGKFPKKIFPSYGYGPGRVVQNLNWLLYQNLGYPPGLSGLSEQPAPETPLYLMSGWGLQDDLLYCCPWTLPEVRGDTFYYPVALPNILT